MSLNKGLIIQQVLPESIGAELGLEPGDCILSIAGAEINDIIEYQYQMAGENIELTVAKPNGIQLIYDIEKDYDEDLGVSFTNVTNDGIRQCHNRCLFCFVDQMPRALRPTLYVKDDDYRYSFLQGTFITLTNIGPEELERIVSLRLSPIYVSVHTTNPNLRVQMLRNKNAAYIMEQLKLLAEHGIKVHGQIVLCPGLNDGSELRKSIVDLSELWPSVQSLAIVPVGLTKFREGLPSMHTIDTSVADETLRMVINFQQHFLQKLGTRFAYLSDEFYLLTGQELPTEDKYEGFPQLENGVGIVRLFVDDFYRALQELKYPKQIRERYLIATSYSASPIIKEVINQLNRWIDGPSLEMVTVENRFFGTSVTVAGLLSGSDLIETLELALAQKDYTAVLLPDILLNDDELTIDNYTVRDLEQRLKTNIVILPWEGSSLVDFLFKL